MSKGHREVIRRSLNRDEWTRIRLAEVERWRTLQRVMTAGWKVRRADYLAPGQYKFKGAWRQIAEGELWGEPDGTFFFRSCLTVPASFASKPLELELVTPTEMLVRSNGVLINALDPNRSRVPLLDPANGGEDFEIELEAYVRSAPDDGRVKAFGGHGCVQIWRNPDWVAYDPNVEALIWDIEICLETAQCEQVDSDVRENLYFHMDLALKALDRDTADRAVFRRSASAAREHLRRHVFEAKGMDGPGALALVGHAHVDIAYHWRVRQGIRKNARTAAVQLALMDAYPEMRYCHTQPFCYEAMRDHYPDLFRRIQDKVREGQWELVGGTYVEPDCNVPSGESLIRQCLFGKRFYLEAFGVDVDTCWLPDVFGNSWIMPQILVRSGIRFFVSNKMSTWNDTNLFPHTHFVWRGVDGTDVFACVPASHFISWLAPGQLMANWDGFQEKTLVGESMNMYGFGDGGGGLTREMLERARRIKRFPGLPRTRQVKASEFLNHAFRNPQDLAVWDDELYLEMHRGTSTTKGALKRLNRRCEGEAREAEILSCVASRFDLPVPIEALRQAWKKVLINQFHDIVPGSHTTPVGQEAEASYGEALESFRAIKAQALKGIGKQIEVDRSKGRPVLLFNALGWDRQDGVRVAVPDPGPWIVVDETHQAWPCQMASEKDGQTLLVMSPTVPSIGYKVVYLRREEGPAFRDPLEISATRMENRFFRLRLDDNAEIVSLVDLRCGREVIAEGERGNAFQLFEDKPGIYEAWDIVKTYRDRSWDISSVDRVEVMPGGPVRGGLQIEKAFSDSRLVQRIWIYRDIPRIDFETWVDWQERNKLLKVCFPVAILARHATYDLSYGAIERPTHQNTSWDQAKFEVCGHQWADLSEAGYGVSLLNDCKYGHDIAQNRMRLTLLRGPIRPDPDADRGEHRFTYALYPHSGAWHEAGVPGAAHALNAPLMSMPLSQGSGSLPAEHAFLRVQGESCHVGALKPSESGEGIILRLVEMHGQRGPVRVEWDGPVASVEETDFIERPEQSIPNQDGRFSLELKPYQIRTFLIREK